MRGKGPKLTLLGKFALVSIIPIALLGLVLALHFSAQIRQDALSNASDSAALIADFGLEPQLEPFNLEGGFRPDLLDALDREFRIGVMEQKLIRVKIWNRSGTIVYSDDRDIIGTAPPFGEGLRRALQGEVSSEVSDLSEPEQTGQPDLGRALEVYVPLRFAGDPYPAGAFELYLPYEPVARSIDERTRDLYLLLFGGLGLLYAALFRIVAAASKRLRRQARENRRQALHDQLTGLPNRSLFRDRLEQVILASRREHSTAAVLIVDLDRFKEVNDTLGHTHGDELLQQIGGRVRAVLRESDTIARMGGDEFGILLRSVAGPSGPRSAAERIQRTLAIPFTLEGLSLEVEASIGIAVYPDHGEDVDTLIQRADVAMYLAKDSHTGIEMYSPERDLYTPARLSLLGELRRAIDARELILYFQPEAEPATGVVTGVEALVRWRHPQRGLILPDEFIPLAERTGLMRPLTLYVLDEALAHCHQWRQQGHDLQIAVNLSARNLHDPMLPDEVLQLLGKWEVPADRLELEITESAILADPVRADEVLSRLSAMGIRIAIDDFGTGYSSLAHLRRLPVDKIKIDRSFVLHLATDESDRVIVGSIIELGRSLGLEVVAEGVETEDLWMRLVELGCQMAQGFFLSPALPAADLLPWLAGLSASTEPEHPSRSLAV